MHVIDLRCRESDNFSINCCKNDNEERLLLGQNDCCKESIYLYFDLPLFLNMNLVQSSKLILYKLPMCCKNQKTLSNQYSVYPLIDFYSPFVGCFSPLRFDCTYKEDFEDNINLGYSEIDVTSMVKSWLQGSIENKGLLITGEEHSPLIVYASEKDMDSKIHPILRIIISDSLVFRTLTEIPCKVNMRSN
ncbi:hypothetical protein [Lachnoclostridium phytofermentans]|uniref:Uncharacterized protein n=1 Tax=Lachnoclostridium phytofermentans (strain ATCC 700394 / DSM 18823 / ISDg) TaxID=357809 RepID=A9KHM7_LACP7|nr:hypothetical protein [Lachnoclostridium phytofermentans]ABX42312.1 hypothetical protein Cphy_1944 [Lachnoclostridium phytofermentans ISDg]